MAIIARRWAFLSLALLCLAAAAPRASACSIPVFRYALERWAPEPYEAVVFHKGPLAADVAATLDWLRKASQADAPYTNVAVETVDLAAKPSEAALALWKAEGSPETPWLVLRYPQWGRWYPKQGDKEPAPGSEPAPETDHKAWHGRLDPTLVKALVDSPSRQEVARQIIGGASAVWLFLESGHKDKDEAAARVLTETLKQMEKELRLPDPTDGGGFGEPDPSPASGDREGLANLKVSFPLVRLSRSSPGEGHFIETLLGIEPDLKKLDKPIALPIFGRGRCLYAFVGDGINADNVSEACGFIVGPCACQVKAMNPGIDLPMQADWDACLEGRPPTEPEPPPLTSAAALAPVVEPGEKAPPVAAPHASPRTVQPPPRTTAHALIRNVLLAVAAGVLVLGAAALVLVRRNGAARS